MKRKMKMKTFKQSNVKKNLNLLNSFVGKRIFRLDFRGKQHCFWCDVRYVYFDKHKSNTLTTCHRLFVDRTHTPVCLFSFAHSSILASYIDVLRTYQSNTPYLNHCVIRMFHRVTVENDSPGILFQMSLFRILQKFHLDPLAKSKQFAVSFVSWWSDESDGLRVSQEILQFGTWLLRKFFVATEKNPYIYAEILFWKDRSIVEDMLDGYRQPTRHEEGEKWELIVCLWKRKIIELIRSRKTKAGSWSIEHQIELRDLFRKIKEEQVENIGAWKRDIWSIIVVVCS